MTPAGYLDFDISLARVGEAFRAQVLQSPAGQAGVTFQLPFSADKLEVFLLRLGRAHRGVRRADSPELRSAKEFGAALFEAVFASEVRACFRSSLDEARRRQLGLRLRLHLEDPSLANLPWEYLYNPSLNQFLALSVHTPIVRYLDLPDRVQPLAVRPPLNVLVMVSSPTDYAALDVENEWHKLSEALDELVTAGKVVLHRLDDASLSTLQQTLRRGEFHIFHFIGHGEFDEQAQDGLLVLEGPNERGQRVSSQYLGMLLHDHASLRLSVLNACEGARTSATDPFAGTAQSLVQQGLPAVIAMQFEIADETAAVFAHEFYRALADGCPVDAALSESRKAIFAAGRDVSWGTPVLYLRSPDARIFEVEGGGRRSTDPERAPFEGIARPLGVASLASPAAATTGSSGFHFSLRLGRFQWSIAASVLGLLLAVVVAQPLWRATDSSTAPAGNVGGVVESSRASPAPTPSAAPPVSPSETPPASAASGPTVGSGPGTVSPPPGSDTNTPPRTQPGGVTRKPRQPVRGSTPAAGSSSTRTPARTAPAPVTPRDGAEESRPAETKPGDPAPSSSVPAASAPTASTATSTAPPPSTAPSAESTPPRDAASEPVHVPSPRESVRATLQRYQTAQERRDAAALARVWTMSDRERSTYARAFQGYRSQSIELQGCQFAIDAQIARVSCEERQTVVLGVGDGRPVERRYRTEFVLLRAAGSETGWTIGTIQRNQR
jgi:hypothetical protein